MPKARTTAIYTSPQDAAAAFYQAFEAHDIDAMMVTWADDEDIVCVHPGGARVVGFDAVRATWEQIFRRRDQALVPTWSTR
jgi:ketosteroid isomerase-like protein